MWKITEEGRQYLQKQMAFAGDGRESYAGHQEDQLLIRECHGIQITNHIDLKTHHVVMLVEGALWDSSGIPHIEGQTAEEICKEGMDNIEKDGIMNLFFFYPDLINYVEGDFDECPMDLQGIDIIKLR